MESERRMIIRRSYALFNGTVEEIMFVCIWNSLWEYGALLIAPFLRSQKEMLFWLNGLINTAKCSALNAWSDLNSPAGENTALHRFARNYYSAVVSRSNGCGKAPATTPPRLDDLHEGCSGVRQMPADDISRGKQPSGAARQISPV